MITKKIYATDLKDYYKQLCALQVKAHKKSYLLVHDEIRKYVSTSNSYTEFGINQGATLAAALLLNPSKVRAYDIKLGWYLKAQQLFEQYATEKDIDYKVVEADTTSIDIDETDVLYIDTLHQYEHLTKELRLHGDKALRTIIFHDTHTKQELKRAVQEYVQRYKHWSIVTDCTENVGFMTIQNENSNTRITTH